MHVPHVQAKLVCLWLCLIISIALQSVAKAQDIASRPARTRAMVEALENTNWQALSEGLEYIEAVTALGSKLTGFQFSQKQFLLKMVQQNDPKGERARSVLGRTDSELVINGGFFSMKPDGRLNPVGLLMDAGIVKSFAWTNVGGYLALDKNGKPHIEISQKGLPDNMTQAIQSKPVIIEPGQIWAMRTNGGDQERRTLVCLKDDMIKIVLIHGGGLSLFEAGWLFRKREWGGYFDCQSAIALDGGGSTQLAVKNHPGLAISGLTKVQNLLAVVRR